MGSDLRPGCYNHIVLLAEMEAHDHLEAAFLLSHNCWPRPFFMKYHLISLQSGDCCKMVCDPLSRKDGRRPKN